MPDTDTAVALVKDCRLLTSLDLGPEVSTDFPIFRVVAEIDAPTRYTGDKYLVHILEPVGLDALVPKMGAALRADRSFDFDSTEEVPKGTKLSVSVSKSHD
jgi:hypothetical protein